MKAYWLVCAAVLAAVAAEAGTVRLADLEIEQMSTGWGQAQRGKSIVGEPLKIAGRPFTVGVGSHAPSYFSVNLAGKAKSFSAMVGVDDDNGKNGKGSLRFSVYADGRVVADSGVMKSGDKARALRADLTGARTAMLFIDDLGNDQFDHGDWCDAVFEMEGDAKPTALVAKDQQLGILTPKPGPEPKFTGPRIFGVRPGHPVLFKVTATGERPLRFAAKGLPAGVTLDSATGLLSGAAAQPGRYRVELTATNARGVATRTFTLAVGPKICLTPPMGWNSWYVYFGGVRDQDMRDAADAMVSSGLIDHGWSYVNVDDFWENRAGEKKDPTLMGPMRLADGTIATNRRFPDMKALTDYIHAKGLKAGLYTSPGPLTCGGCAASWLYEEKDAKTYADWGFDFLKYDRCSYSHKVLGVYHQREIVPYLYMGRLLERQNRDIVYSLCQYGFDFVSAWGERVGAHLWRTTGDSGNNWPVVRRILSQQVGLEMFTGPGQYNDPDMLFVGRVGAGYSYTSRKRVPTKLTPNEQYTQVSLWSLLAAPLLISCDMLQLDEFTLSLLTNDEIIDIDQDELGAGAGLVQESDGTEVWARPLADGSVAAGLFNPQPIAREIVFDLDAAGLTGSWKVRDAWRQRDEGTATRTYRAEVLPHATHVIRLTPQAGAGMKPGFKDVRDAAWWRLFRDRPEAQRPATAPLDCPECQIKLKGSK